MRLYFDCCCYNRPFDDLSQDRIHDESDAVLSLMNRCRASQYHTVLGSTILQIEKPLSYLAEVNENDGY